MKLNTDKDGYKFIALRKDKKRKSFKVHRLVVSCFLKPSELHVNHINGIKDDNHIDNLEYVTHKQNMAHAVKTGLWNSDHLKKYKINQILEAKRFKKLGCFTPAISKATGIPENHLRKIFRGDIWSHARV